MTTNTEPDVSGSGTYNPGLSGSGTMGSMTIQGSGTGTGSGSDPEAMLAGGSWLAGLAMGDSVRAHSPSSFSALSFLFFSFVFL